jgi:hypothetical protein
LIPKLYQWRHNLWGDIPVSDEAGSGPHMSGRKMVGTSQKATTNSFLLKMHLPFLTWARLFNWNIVTNLALVYLGVISFSWVRWLTCNAKIDFNARIVKMLFWTTQTWLVLPRKYVFAWMINTLELIIHQGSVVQRNVVTILALNYLGIKSTGLNWMI